MSARVAWGLAILSCVLTAADIATTAAYESLTSHHAIVIHGFPCVQLAVLGSAIMGALILSRYPRHVIGWLLCVTGLTGALSLLTEAYAVWVIDHDGPGTMAMAGVAGWLSGLVGGQLAISMIAVLFLVAPNGRLLSPRWRIGLWVPAVGSGCFIVALLTVSPTEFDITSDGRDAGAVLSVLFSLGFLLISAGLVISLVALLRRLRISVGAERDQLRFVGAAAGLLVAGVLLLLVVQLVNHGRQTLLSSGLLFVSYAAMPLLLAIAVLRYRLYEIDVIINRAVVFALGTAFAGCGYIVLVVGVGSAIGARTSSFWLSLTATALVALAFQPLRRAVVRLANRLAYGARALPYLALADFNRRLAQTPSTTMLLPAVAESAGLAVGAASAVATLELTPGRVSVAEWSSRRADEDPQRSHEVRIGAHGVELGGVVVTPRKGQSLRNADIALLHDLAGQASQAFLNVATESRLADHVAALDRTTQELAHSRRRIIEADDAARVRLEAAIAREVLPPLAALPDRLALVRTTTDVNGALNHLDRLIADTNAALESLRNITRGVFPTQLSRVGLGTPLRSLLARHGLAGILEISEDAERRFEPRVESAVYFCCAEMLRLSARPARVMVCLTSGQLVVEITGVALPGLELQAIRDRVEAAGGELRQDDGQPLRVRLPEMLSRDGG